jgi:transcriptional regulator with XRE-family HTH domain
MSTGRESQGAWLRAQRQARGWSLATLARQLREAACQAGDTAVPGTKSLCANLYRWEANGGGPSERYRLHLCRVLGIPPGSFGQHPLPTNVTAPQASASHVPGRQGSAADANARIPAPGDALHFACISKSPVLEALAAEFCRQAGLLATLHADCPGYEFWLEPRREAAPLLIAKRKPGYSGGPHTLVTADPDEILVTLRAPSAPSRLAAPPAVRPAPCYGGRA